MNQDQKIVDSTHLGVRIVHKQNHGIDEPWLFPELPIDSRLYVLICQSSSSSKEFRGRKPGFTKGMGMVAFIAAPTQRSVGSGEVTFLGELFRE